MKVEIVRELREGKKQACIVKRGESYFVVHPTTPPRDAPPTERPGFLAFAATPGGAIADWCEVATGGTREEVITKLER